MKVLRFLVAAVAAIVAIPAPAPAGWGTSVCVAVAAPVTMQTVSREWRKRSDDPNRAYLYECSGGSCRVVGGYDLVEGVYRPSTDGGQTYGERIAEPPVALPSWAAPVNFGLDPSKLDAVPKYFLNGVEVDKGRAYQSLGDPKGLADDSARLRVSIVGGTKEQRAGVKADLSTLDRSAFAVRDFAADDWRVQSAGFVATGSPTIYCQAPDGKVLHRQDDPKDAASALRKAKANYDPAKDPDLRRGTHLPFGGVNFLQLITYLGLGCIGVNVARAYQERQTKGAA